MKLKQMKGKLTLNKKTISDLNGSNMDKIQGGFPTYSQITCIKPCVLSEDACLSIDACSGAARCYDDTVMTEAAPRCLNTVAYPCI